MVKISLATKVYFYRRIALVGGIGDITKKAMYPKRHIAF